MRPRRGRPDLDVEQELEAFVALLTDEKVAAGMAPEDARRAALVEAGSLEAIREDARDLRPGVIFDRLRQDLRFGLRMLARTPGSTVAVILALALGIGATSATFSVVDAVLLRPLPYADSDRLVAVLHARTNPTSAGNFNDWQRHAEAFDAMGAAEYWTPNLTENGPAEKLYALHVSPEVLPMLGIPPAMGRFPMRADAGAREVAIGDGLWRRLFAADPLVLGRSVMLDGMPHDVVGVMPKDFRFAPFWATRAELWAAFDLVPRANYRDSQSLRVFARIKPGIGLDQARASMATLTAELESRYPGTNRHVTVTPLKDMVVGDVRMALVVLFAAVALVLLIACANVAHLLLARAASRERELAVRGALGATRTRIVTQLLTESGLLAGAGGFAGVLVAGGAISVFRALGASSIPRLETVALDGRVLAFTAVISLATTLIFGLMPAFRQARPHLSTVLRDAERGSTSRRAMRIRRLLIASEVAMAVVLLLNAGLLVRSFVTLRSVDPGFDPVGLTSMVLSVKGSVEAAPDRRIAFYTTVLDRLRALPGVEAAGAINHSPLVGDTWGVPFSVEGRPEPSPADIPRAVYRVVLPGYFETMRVPLVRGRDFTDADRTGAQPVAIVSQHLADELWPGESPLGKRVRVAIPGDNDWRAVVGVTRHLVRNDWQDQPGDEVYLPLLQSTFYRTESGAHAAYLTYVIRARVGSAVLPAAATVVSALSPNVPVSEVADMAQVVDVATSGARFTVTLLGGFSAVALILAVVGLYGVMSCSVADRRREIGIRLALGATRRSVVAGVVGEGMLIAGAGTILGAVASALLGSALARLFFGVAPIDPPTFAAVAGVLVLSAAAAAYLPARRVSRIDPQQELR